MVLEEGSGEGLWSDPAIDDCVQTEESAEIMNIRNDAPRGRKRYATGGT